MEDMFFADPLKTLYYYILGMVEEAKEEEKIGYEDAKREISEIVSKYGDGGKLAVMLLGIKEMTGNKEVL